MKKLISFITPSRRLDNIKAFFDNIEQTVSDPSCVEVLVKFDDDQAAVPAFIESEINKRAFTIKYIITPRLEGIFSVWVAMEQLFYMTDPDSYFIMIMSDEPRFEAQHWDKVLRNYIGFFKDDVFRLRLSSMKIANYATHYECTFRPDSFPIYTRRWLELTEGTGNCWGSDAYQQCVAFQLALGPGSYFNIYRENALCRDVVVNDIELDGLEFGVGVSAQDQKIRHKRNLKEWSRLASFPMQEHFSYLARRINCYVWACEHGIKKFKLIKHKYRKTVAIATPDGHEVMEFSYAVPRLVVYLQNIMRVMVVLPRRVMVWILEMLRPVYPVAVWPIKKILALTTGYDMYKNEHILAGQLSIKRRIKNVLLKALTYMSVPVYLLFLSLDKLFTQSPPGISVLHSDKPDIPKGINPPSKLQIDWLKQELERQLNSQTTLSRKSFEGADVTVCLVD